MAININLFGIVLLVCLFLIILTGFIFYMFRNYCEKKTKGSRRTSTDPKHALGILDTYDASSYKTTTDDENTLTTRPMKTHTFDQILKQEERSAYSVHTLKLPRPDQMLQRYQQQQQETSS